MRVILDIWKTISFDMNSRYIQHQYTPYSRVYLDPKGKAVKMPLKKPKFMLEN